MFFTFGIFDAPWDEFVYSTSFESSQQWSLRPSVTIGVEKLFQSLDPFKKAPVLVYTESSDHFVLLLGVCVDNVIRT